MRWMPKSETPPAYRACLLALDVKDNAGAGLDEGFTIAWHDGDRWFDVHSTNGVDPGPWLVAWVEITAIPP